jgi:hypothetical protein
VARSPHCSRQLTRIADARWCGFLFELETEDGTPAEPPTVSSAVPNWRSGDTIQLGHRTLRVVRIRDDDADQPPVLIVEEAS